MPFESRSGTMNAVTPSSTTDRIPPAAVVTTGVAGRQRFHEHVRQAVHVAAVVLHRRDTDDVGGREQLADLVLRQVAEETDAIGGASHRGPLAQLAPQGAVAGNRQDHARQIDDGVDEYSKPFLRTSLPAATTRVLLFLLSKHLN